MGSESGTSSGNDGNPRPVWRSADSVSRRVLDDVLKQTAELNSVEFRIDPADLSSLIEVAQRRKGAEFELHPVVFELVYVILARQMKGLGHSDEQFAKIADRVATTLFENPESNERLRSLWVRLSTA